MYDGFPKDIFAILEHPDFKIYVFISIAILALLLCSFVACCCCCYFKVCCCKKKVHQEWRPNSASGYDTDIELKKGQNINAVTPGTGVGPN